jgi:mono/diheme cytochrome c family protein
MRVRRPNGSIFLSVSFGLSLFSWCATAADSPKKATAHVDFNRDIRPILSENCYKCHGPDDGARKAKLRFDIRAEALKPAKSGDIPIVPGSPEKSQLVARVTASDPDDRMPPIKSGKTLTAVQIDLLRRWVAEGAPYATHWAYAKPVRSPLPNVRNGHWPLNPIDRFVLARLEKEGLRPSPAADRYTLIRRVSLDLTGLPPTPDEVDRFVKDRSSRAYEELVDRLLKTPAFGEHWARMWLDLARYADSAGYADDPPRTIWPYRDYVIRSFNANKHFDRFTLEQIAGDLLDDGDEDDLIGSAFHRNTMTNNEGGTSDEEFRNAAIVDRVNTTMAVWMGTSMACAQCHNHKYDPITQQDYFRLFAILNNTADADLKDESPVFEIFTPAQEQERKKLQTEITAIETKFKTPTPESLVAQAEWESKFPGEAQWLSLQPLTLKADSGGLIERAEDNVEHV